MKRTILHICSLFPAAAISMVLAVGMGACADSAEELAEYEDGIYSVGLSLTVDGVSAMGATPPGDYDDGRATAYENYINVPDGDFRVMLFEPEKPYKLVAAIGDVQVTAVEADATVSKTYMLVGRLPKRIEDGSYKFVMLANWEGSGARYPEVTPGVTTLDEVAEASVFNYAAGFDLRSAQGFPLYGIKDCDNVQFVPDRVADLGTLHLLRAMAKIELRAAAGSLPISKAVLTRANAKGLAAPRGIYRQEDYVKGSYAADYLDRIHLPEEGGTITEIPFRQLADGRYVLYVPEYDNTSASAGEKARIRLFFEKTGGWEYFVDFKYYNEETAGKAGAALDAPFDIRRNYYYIYTIDKQPDSLIVDVQPYACVTLQPVFGLERDEEGYIVVRNKQGEVIKYIRTDDKELTLGPIEMPFYGTISGVYDNKRRALLGFMGDTCQVFYNYSDEEGKNMTSWEIYASDADGDIDFLSVDYIRIPDRSLLDSCTQNFYDRKGRVIERYVYPDNKTFEARTKEGEGADQLVGYAGERYGDKTITYYSYVPDEQGDTVKKPYMRIEIKTVDGQETEIYTNVEKDNG